MATRKTSIKPSPFPDPRPREIYALVLAAGVGKRMHSRTAKVLHPLAGKPMIRYVVEAALEAGVQRVVVIVGDQAAEVQSAVGSRDRRVGFCVQERPLGTGHAVLSAEKALKGLEGTLLILNGDLPSLLPSTLRTFLDFHFQAGAPLTLLTAVIPEPGNYGRIVRNYNSEVARIVEATDATPEERQIKEINGGIYCVQLSHLFSTSGRPAPTTSRASTTSPSWWRSSAQPPEGGGLLPSGRRGGAGGQHPPGAGPGGQDPLPAEGRRADGGRRHHPGPRAPTGSTPAKVGRDTVISPDVPRGRVDPRRGLPDRGRHPDRRLRPGRRGGDPGPLRHHPLPDSPRLPDRPVRAPPPRDRPGGGGASATSWR